MSDQTEMPKRLLDGFTLLGRAWDDATAPTSAVRRAACRQAPKSLHMRDPGGFRHEAVATLNELLYLAVGRHPNSSSDGTGPLTRCGIDTVEIARIERLLVETPHEDLLRIFSKGELCDVGEGAGRTASLAARFAAKEACLKLFPREAALGLIDLADFALARDGYGAPRVLCSPRALELIARHRLRAIAVSLAHDKTNASAVAVAEPASPGEQGPPAEPDRTRQSIG